MAMAELLTEDASAGVAMAWTFGGNLFYSVERHQNEETKTLRQQMHERGS